MTAPQRRWFMDCDNDGHWYLIPEEQREQWELGMNDADSDGFDQSSDNWPEGALSIGASPSTITFTDPIDPYPV